MHRARRLASAAVVASLAVAGLSACRQEPSVAAYVGDTRITESRVQAVWDDAKAAQAAAPAPAGGDAASATPAAPITRADVVRTLVSAQVLDEVAKRKSLTLPPEATTDEAAQITRLPASTEYVQLYARADNLLKLLRQQAQGAPAATDADLREVFDVLSANQAVEPGTTFETFKTNLPEQNKQLVQAASAVRKEITDVTGPMNIKVNPRYQPLGISVLEFQTQNGALKPLVTAPLGANKDTAPVADAS